MDGSGKFIALLAIVGALAVVVVVVMLTGVSARVESSAGEEIPDGEEPSKVPIARPEKSSTKPPPCVEDDTALGGRIEALEKAAEGRDKRIRELEEENRALKAETARLAAAPAAGPEPRKKGYRFGLKAKTPVLDEADWPALATQFTDLRKALPPVIEEFCRTGTVSFKTQLEMGEKNQPLAIFTVKASGEAKGMAPNSTFTHPAVVASMIRALLDQAGLPLSEVQDEAVRAAGEAWSTREEARIAGYAADAPNLLKLVEEVESRQRFLDDLRTFLSAGQQAALFDPATEGRAGVDLLSPALNLAMRTPVTEPTREALEKTLVRESFKLLGIERNPDEFAWFGVEWLAGLPEATVPVTEDKFRMDAAFPALPKLLRCARAQLAAMKRLLDRENFDEATGKRIRTLTILAMPQVVLTPEKKDGEGK